MKYQIDKKALAIRIIFFLLIGAIAWGAFFWLKKGDGEQISGEVKTWDVLVQTKDQTNPNPDEDARSSFKAGDVVLVRESGREWTTIEKSSYLILKMKLTAEQAQKLTQPETIELSEKEALEQGILSEEMKKELPKEELEQMLKKEVRARMYRIDLDKIDSSDKEKEYEWKVVEEKSL